LDQRFFNSQNGKIVQCLEFVINGEITPLFKEFSDSQEEGKASFIKLNYFYSKGDREERSLAGSKDGRAISFID